MRAVTLGIARVALNGRHSPTADVLARRLSAGNNRAGAGSAFGSRSPHGRCQRVH